MEDTLPFFWSNTQRRYVQMIDEGQYDLKKDSDFVTIVRLGALLCDMQQKELAEVLEVTTATLQRWARGVNLPRPRDRKGVLADIREIVHKTCKLSS